MKIKRQLTNKERIILEEIPIEYKFIARDQDGGLYVYKEKPLAKYINTFANLGYWKPQDHYQTFSISLYSHLFDFIKWEDEEPYSIFELLKQL